MNNDVEYLLDVLIGHLNIFFCKVTSQGIFLKEMKTSLHKMTCERRFMAASFTIAKNK